MHACMYVFMYVSMYACMPVHMNVDESFLKLFYFLVHPDFLYILETNVRCNGTQRERKQPFTQPDTYCLGFFNNDLDF